MTTASWRKALFEPIAPGPIIWAWAIAAPVTAAAGRAVWWLYWLMTALSWFVILTWGWPKLRRLFTSRPVPQHPPTEAT